MLRRHFVKLIIRMLLLIAAVFLFFTDYHALDFTSLFEPGCNSVILWIIWAMFTIEMLFRLFPNQRITIGARKHYKCSYKPVQNAMQNDDKSMSADISRKNTRLHRGAALSAISWMVITAAVMLTLHLLELLSPETVLIWMLLLSVADLVFVLFLCPFRILFMKNRCCEDCRIYNWDYFMMFAPLILFPGFYSVSLFAIAAAVVIRWEAAVWRHPNYFMIETNDNLKCENCKDKLCKSRIIQKINEEKPNE